MKFYETKWFAWVTLIFFAPIGIFVLWKYKHYGKGGSVALTLIFSIVFLAALGSNADTTKKDKIATTGTQKEILKVEEEIKQTPTVTVTPSPIQTPTATPKIFDEWVKSQFSAWDGSHIALVELVKKNMNDPKSFQHAETKYTIDRDKKSINIHMKYRGKNAFGGLILTSITAVATYEDNLIKVIKEN